MPTINRNQPRTGTTGTAGTAATNATNATNATDNTGATPGQPPPIRSASGEIIQPRATPINGLQGATMNATGTTNRFARDTSFDAYGATGDGPVQRGFIRPDAEAIPGGFRLNVKSFHKTKNSKVTLYLIAEVLDQKTNQLKTITLSVLTNNEDLCGNGYRGDHYFDIKFDDVNKFLKSKNPNLKITPGHTTLGVAARWSNGHQAGGFGRGGTFRVPLDSGTQNVHSVPAASRANTDEADLPLDMQVAYPPQLVQQVPTLKPDGNIVSRLESELKGEASKQEMTSAVTQMYKLVEQVQQGDKSGVERMLGKDWTIETVNRYWIKDDGGSTEGKPGTGFFKGFRVDDDGLPIQDPMRDQYMDDPNLRMTRHQGAIRLRTNKQATVINVKPGGGRRDDRSNITQRVEVGVELKPGATVQEAGNTLRGLATNRQFSGSIFNHAQRQVNELDGQLNLQNALQPWLEVVQDRHKFTVKNEKTGVEIELSFDKVNTKTLRPNLAEADGSPREAEFYVLEAELDHLQLASSNASNYAAGSVSNSSGTFSNDQQQDTWLASTSDQVTMDLEPRLHELDDLQNKSFRQTTSYKQFEGATGKLIPALFPNGLTPGIQKAAAAAEKLGLVHFDDAGMRASLKSKIVDAGFEWTPELKKAVEDSVADSARRTNLDIALVNGQANNINTLCQHLQVNVATLKYDLGKVKKRVKDKLHELGYESSAPIEQMFDKMTTTNIPPAHFEQFLQRMPQYQDAQVMTQFAQKLGVSPAPAPTGDAKRLFSGSWGQMLEQKLDQAFVDKSCVPALEKFFIDASKANGGSVFEVRSYINNMHSNPENRLNTLAQQRGLTGQQPTLRASVDRLVDQATTNTRNQFLSVNKEMKKFLGEVSKNKTLNESIQFVNSLTSQAGTRINTMAQSMGISPPKLDVDLKAIEANLQQYMKGQYLLFTPELRQFISDAVNAGADPATLTTQLRQNTESVVKREAGRLNITEPKMAFDFQAIENYLQPQLTNQLIQFTPEIKQFVKDTVNAGIPPAQLTRGFQQLASQPDLQLAMRAAGIYIAGINFPQVKHDVQAVSQRTLQQLQTWANAFASGPEFDKFINDALKAGVAPAQMQNFAYQTAYRGRAQGQRYANNVPLANLPKLPIDTKALIQYWKGRLGTQMTPEREKYLEQALPQALQHDSFQLNAIYNQNMNRIMQYIPTWSGVARPQGV
jgi:hypothetical protein